MRAPNHIAGGVVFTGIFCSFWNVNIFANPTFLGLTVFASLLPDIDHSRSLIGKIFLPVSRYLDRSFGHRTITHSLVFFIATGFLVALIGRVWQVEGLGLVYAFAFGSHLIFDMLTRQGVPLFYPWKRNPCVIGANPEMRLSGKGSGEVVVFSVFLVLLYFCFPLFQNGFWISYNKNFNTLKHLHSSALQTPDLLRVDYKFENSFDRKAGSGLLVHHGKNEAILLSGRSLVKIGAGDVIRELQPNKTTFRKKFSSVSFEAVTLDSLRTMAGEIIVSGEIVSEQGFQIRTNQGVEATQKASLEWSEGFTINVLAQDSSELQRKRIELAYAESMLAIERDHLAKLKADKRKLLQVLDDPGTGDYEKEVSTKKLREVGRKIDSYELNDAQVIRTRREVKQLEEKYGKSQRFSGSLTVLRIIDGA